MQTINVIFLRVKTIYTGFMVCTGIERKRLTASGIAEISRCDIDYRRRVEQYPEERVNFTRIIDWTLISHFWYVRLEDNLRTLGLVCKIFSLNCFRAFRWIVHVLKRTNWGELTPRIDHTLLSKSMRALVMASIIRDSIRVSRRSFCEEI